MTEEEYCLTSNLARLRTINNLLGQIHECEQYTLEDGVELRARVGKTIEAHETFVETAQS